MVANANFMKELREAVPERNRSIIMGCKSGKRSIMASQLALNDQYDDVHNLTGGFDLWKNEGLPWTT